MKHRHKQTRLPEEGTDFNATLNSLSAQAIEEMMAGGTVEDSRAKRHAEKFHTERTLVGWTEAQNKDRGIAPSWMATLREWDVVWGGVEHQRHSPGPRREHSRAAAKKKRKFGQRFLRRWGLSRGLFKTGDCLEVRLAQQKVDRQPPRIPCPENIHSEQIGRARRAETGGHFPGAE